MNTVMAHEITGFAGLVVRVGEALERWGRDAAEPLSRDELVRLHTVRREAAVAQRGDALIGIAPLR